MADISIVIPAYNAEKYLGAAVQSVLDQTYSDWELIIVDDGSSDRTPLIAQKFADHDARIFLVRQQNAGVSAARMTGFYHSDPAATYITFIDADDVWEPDALTHLRAALCAAPQMLAAHGLARFIDEQGEPLAFEWATDYGRERLGIVDEQLVPWQPEWPTTFAVMAFQNPIFTSGQVLLRRAAFEKSGGYDPRLHAAEDWHLWLRLTAGGDFAYVDQPVLGYRRHPDAVSMDRKWMANAAAFTRREILASSELTAEQRRIARVAYRLNERMYTRLRWSWAWSGLAQGNLGAAASEARRAVMSTVRSSLVRV